MRGRIKLKSFVRFTPRYMEKLKLCPHRNLNTNIYSSITYNSWKVEVSHTSVSDEWILKAANPYNGVLIGLTY